MMSTTKRKSKYAQAAANIKRELAEKFPGIKFSVRSKSFSMGNSVDVSWELGPTTKEVDAIISKYEYGRFDSMQDLQYNDTDPERCTFRALHGEAKYVHGSRSMPEGLFDRLCRDIAAYYGELFISSGQRREGDSFDLGSVVHRIFSRTSFPAGAEYIGVASGWELELTGTCASDEEIRIVHTMTDEETEIRAVVKREFDYLKTREQEQRPALRLVG